MKTGDAFEVEFWEVDNIKMKLKNVYQPIGEKGYAMRVSFMVSADTMTMNMNVDAENTFAAPHKESHC